MGNPVLFYPLATLMIAAALGVILARHPVYAVLSLVVTLFALSGLFVLLGAYFVAIIQVLIYAGAILVLFLFVVMLLDMAPPPALSAKGGSNQRFDRPEGPKAGGTFRLIGGMAGLFFLAQLIPAIGAFGSSPGTASPLAGTTQAVGRQLFTTYALPFEAASGLLLVGIIGAIVLAKKKL